ncbi:hypothetical protein UZ36_01125 [Candidatus Nitromaritima sp. SCGC AAA799-C22]|nr:hypothetical protein UZ36_01125 [Candidatus Nitromaritima sp. SCGC AAA799-C22]
MVGVFFCPPSHWDKMFPVKKIYLPNHKIRKAIGLCWIVLCVGAFALPNASAAPQRIISSSPSITEILFAIGAGDRVVGVTDHCKYPEAACRLPSIGGLLNPSVETWLSMKPDLIIHQADSRTIQKNAANLGIPTLPVSLNSLKNILHTIQSIAAALEIPESGQKLALQLQTKIDQYRTRLAGQTPRQVLMLLSDSNDPSRDLYAVGRGTFLDELLTIAGGENVLPDTMARYPKISKEYIIGESPEIIMEVGPKSNLSDEEVKKRKQDWGRFATIQAVKDDRIYFIGADYIIIPGPRLLNILDDFTRAIHPELFSNTPGHQRKRVSP